MILLPEDRSEWWAPPIAPCFFCSGELSGEPVTVYWHGEDHLQLHPACAAKLGTHLIADAREADLATGSGYWSNRARKVIRASLLRQEHAT